jgi:hypothetical protein
MLQLARAPLIARPICWSLTVALLVLLPWHAAVATVIDTGQILSATEAAGDAAGRARLEGFLARADVARVLEAWGVEPAEVQARVAALSDAEVASVARQLDRLPAAGGSVVGPIIGALVFVFVVLLITDLLGLTDVFPFVKKKKKQSE